MTQIQAIDKFFSSWKPTRSPGPIQNRRQQVSADCPPPSATARIRQHVCCSFDQSCRGMRHIVNVTEFLSQLT